MRAKGAAIAGSISVVVVLAFLTLSGKPLPVGTFEGRKTLAVNPGTDPVVADQLRRITLRIRDDGAADLEDGGLPWEGHVTRSGDALDFEVYAVDGINIAKQPGDLPRDLKIAVNPDGTLEYARVVLRQVTPPFATSPSPPTSPSPG